MKALDSHFLVASDMYLGILDGKKCGTLNDFYNAIQEALQFPAYFGKNLDALDECLNDLSGIEEERIVLLLLNYSSFLADEDSKIQVVEDIITQAENENPAFKVYYLK